MTGTPAAVTGSFALLSAMGFVPTTTTLDSATVGGKLQLLQVGQLEFVQATARAVYIDDDFYANPFFVNTFGGTGIAGSGLSPTTAYGFRSSRVKQSIGRGYKRFVGVPEGAVGGGGVIEADAKTLMGNLATVMGATLNYTDEGNALSFAPAIVSKEKYTTPSGREAYQYWDNEVDQAAHTAVGILWEIYSETRTQGSRQYGRGS